MTACIELHHGVPTLFLDGKPVFYGMMWGSAPEVDRYPINECARLFGEAGVHFYTFDIGTGGASPEWCGPRPDAPDHFDFSTLATRFQRVIDADPLARFHLRVHLEMPEWWQRLYPQECELLSDGRRMCQSFASNLWHDQAVAFLTALVTHIRSVGLGERVVAYQCGAGTTGEWVKGPGAMGLVCGDYSQPMQDHFRAWLRHRYQDDLNALRQAWADADLTFETATVPEAARQLPSSLHTFRDPSTEQPVIDYYRCLAQLSASRVIDFCAAVKQASQGTALAGAFYGYLLELAWNAGFFGEGLDSEFATYQRSGHLGLAQVLQSPHVDFLVSPYSYGFRGLGGDGSAMPPPESMRLHKKLYIFEDDTRTHLSIHDKDNYGRGETLAESIALLQRNFSYVLTHGQGIWWLAGWNSELPHIDPGREPGFQPVIRRIMQIGEWALTLDRAPSSQVAVILDDESMYHQWARNTLDLPLIYQQRLWGLAHMGAPFDVYLLNDLISADVKPYSLYVFLNAFHIEPERRQALNRLIRKNNQAALWIYAPGYHAGDETLDSMTSLTGISFSAGPHPWGPLIQLIDFDHPITRGLTPDVTWGTNSLLNPVFHVADDRARSLGNVVYSQGRCRPGFVVKEFSEWRSIYSAAPNLPANILRGLARYAGVHVYSEDGDTLYATPDLLAIHTARGGPRTLRLPAPAEVVYDLFEQRSLARQADQFEITLAPSSTRLFYTGPAAKLDTLPGYHT